MILLPRAEELTIPFVASGGMADARSLVAALAMGAQGMNMGTRFIATKEAPVHPNVKQALLKATELDTRLSCAHCVTPSAFSPTRMSRS